MSTNADQKIRGRMMVLRKTVKLADRVVFSCLSTAFIVIYVLAMSGVWLFEDTSAPTKVQYSVWMFVIVCCAALWIYKKIRDYSKG